MEYLEDYSYNNTPLNSDNATAISGLCIQLSKLVSNFPDHDFDELVKSAASVVLTFDTYCGETSKLEDQMSSMNDDLRDALAQLALERDRHRVEIDGFLKTQDELMKNNNSLDSKILALNSKLSDITQINKNLAQYQLDLDKLNNEYNSVQLANRKLIAENSRFQKKLVKAEKSSNLLMNELNEKSLCLSNLRMQMSVAAQKSDMWLSDDMLSPHFDLLNKELCEHRKDILFIDPSMTQLLKLETDVLELNQALSDINFASMNYVFFCLNDCRDGLKSSGGTHWSLLLFDVSSQTATHYDSAHGMNGQEAAALLANLKLSGVRLCEGRVAQQTAGHECGLHVLVNARLLAGRLCAEVSLELLECLQACLSVYPGPAGEYKSDVLKILSCVMSDRAPRKVLLCAASCVALAAGIGGGGKQGATYKAAWCSQHIGLVTLLHSLLDRLFEHVDMPSAVILETPLLSLEPVTERDALSRAQRLVTQFVSVTHCLQAMLLETFPVAKSVAMDAILDLVVHAQRPSLGSLGSSREALAVAAVLPTVQFTTIRLIEALIFCVGRNLVVRAGLVSSLCSQAVVWTQRIHGDWPYAMDKPFRSTRTAVYSCLVTWLTVAGPAALTDTLLDNTLPVLLADVHARKPTVTLRVGSKHSKGKKKQQMLVSQEERSEKLGDSVANRYLCQAALRVLEQLVRAAAFASAKYLTAIGSTVLSVVEELPVPYSDAGCLVALYRLLRALCLSPHPPSLAPALSVFTAGLHYSHPQVKAECESALVCLEAVVRPTAASLHFPRAATQPQSEEPLSKRARIDSERKPTLAAVNSDIEEMSNDSVTVVDIVSLSNNEDKYCLELTRSPSENSIEVIDDEQEKQTLKRSKLETGLKSGTIEAQPSLDELHCEDSVQTFKEYDEFEVRSNDLEINEIMTETKKVPAVGEFSEICKEAVNSTNNPLDDADVSEMLMDFNDEVDVTS